MGRGIICVLSLYTMCKASLGWAGPVQMTVLAVSSILMGAISPHRLMDVDGEILRILPIFIGGKFIVSGIFSLGNCGGLMEKSAKLNFKSGRTLQSKKLCW